MKMKKFLIFILLCFMVACSDNCSAHYYVFEITRYSCSGEVIEKYESNMVYFDEDKVVILKESENITLIGHITLKRTEVAKKGTYFKRIK